jgi:hypothetical protein
MKKQQEVNGRIAKMEEPRARLYDRARIIFTAPKMITGANRSDRAETPYENTVAIMNPRRSDSSAGSVSLYPMPESRKAPLARAKSPVAAFITPATSNAIAGFLTF